MQYELSQLCNVITKGTTPSTIGYEFTNEGINFIKSEQLISSRSISYCSKYFISDDAYNALKRSQLMKYDILISIAGAYLGKLAIVNENDLPANTNQAVGIIRVDKNLVNPIYLFYYLSTNKMRNIISSYNAQSAQPNINLTQLGNLQIEVPLPNVQNHIVNTISFLLLKFL